MLIYCMILYLHLKAYWICGICEVSAVNAQGIFCMCCVYECFATYLMGSYDILASGIVFTGLSVAVLVYSISLSQVICAYLDICME